MTTRAKAKNSKKTPLGRVFTIKFIQKLILYGVLGGFFLAGAIILLRLFPEKTFEISNKYFGKIKASAEQATLKESKIQEVLERVEKQRDTIDAAFHTASDAQRNASNAMVNVEQAAKQLSSISTNAEFLKLVMSAYGDDRRAFDELWKMVVIDRPLDADLNKTMMAAGVLNAVMQAHNASLPFEPKSFFPHITGYSEDTVTIEELKKIFDDSGGFSPNLLQWLYYSPRFTKLQKMELLLHLRKTSISLFVCEWATRDFFQLVNIGYLVPLQPKNIQIMEEKLTELRKAQSK